MPCLLAAYALSIITARMDLLRERVAAAKPT
jgi:hypothetical protein